MSVHQLEAVGVKITRIRGDEVMGLCPFHSDSNPSFSANLKKRVYYCHSCGAKGGFSQLGLTNSRKVTFEGYAELLASGTVEDYERTIYALPDEYIPIRGWTRDCAKFWDYLKGRGVYSSAIYRFNLGYCTHGMYENRIIIPLGLGFVARSVYTDHMGGLIYGKKNFRKYLFPLGMRVSKGLYNFHPESKSLLLVEGTMDVIKLATFNIRATSTFTCKVSDAQIDMIVSQSKADRVYVCFDGDEAGRDGAVALSKRLVDYFGTGKVSIVSLPDGKDPGDCSGGTILKALRASKPAEEIYSYVKL